MASTLNRIFKKSRRFSDEYFVSFWNTYMIMEQEDSSRKYRILHKK